MPEYSKGFYNPTRPTAGIILEVPAIQMLSMFYIAHIVACDMSRIRMKAKRFDPAGFGIDVITGKKVGVYIGSKTCMGGRTRLYSTGSIQDANRHL